MEGSLDREIAALAARQHGVFTLAQAGEIGFGDDQRMFRVRSGRWHLRYPGVYVIAGLPESWRSRVLSACWAAPDLAIASHRSAAELWDLPGRRTDIVEISCRRKHRSKSGGLVVHETKSLSFDHEIETIDGIPTASIEQTLLGLAAVVPDTVVEMAVDRALHRQQTTITRLEEFVRREGKQGRNGIGVLRTLVRGLDVSAGIPESAMETKLKQLLRRRGLPMPKFQYEIWHEGRFIARVDAAYPEHRIAIEYDSYEHHLGNHAIDRDNDRRARLSGIRWSTVTFTGDAIRRNGGSQIETLRSLLGFGAARL